MDYHKREQFANITNLLIIILETSNGCLPYYCRIDYPLQQFVVHAMNVIIFWFILYTCITHINVVYQVRYEPKKKLIGRHRNYGTQYPRLRCSISCAVCYCIIGWELDVIFDFGFGKATLTEEHMYLAGLEIFSPNYVLSFDFLCHFCNHYRILYNTSRCTAANVLECFGGRCVFMFWNSRVGLIQCCGQGAVIIPGWGGREGGRRWEPATSV